MNNASIESFGNENLQIELGITPTYLKELCIEDEEIILVHLKRDPIKEELLSPKEISPVEADSNSTLDLTGNPLKVDLSGDDSQISSGLTQKVLYLWKQEEETHFSLDLPRARQFINQQFRIKKCEGDSSKPFYVVCDGNNSESTVILGAQKSDKFLMTTKVNILGYLPKDHQSLSVEQMEKCHILNTHIKDCKINYNTKFKYYLYGSFLQKTFSLYDLEIYGSICIETNCNSKCPLESPQSLLNSKNMVIVGHPLSSVHFLWEDLCLLQTFLNILSSPDRYNNSETIISVEPSDVSNVYKEISNIIGFNFQKKEAKPIFSLANIRVVDTLDKLWNVMKRCESLADLRESFHFLFEELTETQTNLKLSEKESSNIATIVNGILQGNLAVPTITYSQALEFLFELGTDKLKKDYQAIIKYYYPSSESSISSKWSQLKSKLNLQDGFRKTRITMNPGKVDLNQNTSRLSYLGKLHITVEFIYLVKTEAGLPEETFDYFCERVYKNFMENPRNSSEDFSDLQRSKLCDYEVLIDVQEKKLIKNDLPRMWSMKMTSSNHDMEVTTLFHLSGQPIFPPTIYNNFDVLAEGEEDSVRFFVTKMERYKNILA